MASLKLVRKLDIIFSQYIRLRDTKNGYFTCCSCGQTKPYEQADAGHYINRRYMATRWREDNVHAQCRYCNRFREGNGSGYTRFILRTYGMDRLDLLDGLKNETVKFTDVEIELMINDYKQKVKLLKQAVIQ